MRTAIDSAGRIVVPKSLRDALGLRAGQAIDIISRGGYLELVPAATPMHLEDRGDGVVAVPDADIPPLTTDEVRQALEQLRR